VLSKNKSHDIGLAKKFLKPVSEVANSCQNSLDLNKFRVPNFLWGHASSCLFIWAMTFIYFQTFIFIIVNLSHEMLSTMAEKTGI
jgi:hypothetical protein